jgi:hypothetical protein
LLIFSGCTPVDPADVPLSEYVDTMQIDQEILDLASAKDLNTDLLDVNAIPPERKDLWPDEKDQDPDCHIVDDPRANVPAKTPPPEEPLKTDPQEETFYMHPWMISETQTHRQLYFCPRVWCADLVARDP